MIEPYYIDSDCTLYNAKWEDVLLELPERSVDMVLCDLPYGVTSCEWDTKPDLGKLWGEYRRVTKPTAAIVLFGVQPFTTDLINSARDIFKHELIWEKSRPSGIAQADTRPMRIHENILVFGGQEIFNAETEDRILHGKKLNRKTWKTWNTGGNHGLKETEKKMMSERRNPTSILKFASVGNNGKTIHPTEKPVDLCAWLIRTYTNESDVVLDNTCGVGTTLVAAKLTGRRSIGVESELKYCELAVKERLNRPLPLFDDERANYEQQQIFS